MLRSKDKCQFIDANEKKCLCEQIIMGSEVTPCICETHSHLSHTTHAESPPVQPPQAKKPRQISSETYNKEELLEQKNISSQTFEEYI